jgi:excisionase family DNA binding protein
VAQILRLSKAKAYRLMQTGEIRSIQFDRTTRVRRQDLDEFIKTHMK